MIRSNLILIQVLAVFLFILQGTEGTRRIRDVTGDGSGKIADFAMKALGSFKKFMKEGHNELGIPSLDPVYMDSFNYSLDNSPVGFKMDISFDSPVLTGLSSYELSGASEVKNSNGAVLQMTVVFPTIQIKGRYKTNGNMFGFFGLSGFGEFEIVGSSQVLSAEAKLRPVNHTLQLEYINSQFVGGRVKAQFNDGSGGTTQFASLMRDFLSVIGSHVFDNKLKPIITRSMNDYMKEWLNGAFASVSLSEILGQSQGNGGQTQNFPQQTQQFNNGVNYNQNTNTQQYQQQPGNVQPQQTSFNPSASQQNFQQQGAQQNQLVQSQSSNSPHYQSFF